MGLSALNNQIVELAKRGFVASQIAAALSMSEEQVNAVILQDESAVREIHKHDLDSKFAKLEDLALKGLEHLAMYGENEQTRYKVFELIVKQRAGLLKPRERVTVNNNFKFLMDRAEKARAKRDATVIDINAQVLPEKT